MAQELRHKFLKIKFTSAQVINFGSRNHFTLCRSLHFNRTLCQVPSLVSKLLVPNLYTPISKLYYIAAIYLSLYKGFLVTLRNSDPIESGNTAPSICMGHGVTGSCNAAMLSALYALMILRRPTFCSLLLIILLSSITRRAHGAV